MRKGDLRIMWAYILDRAGQYDPNSGIVTALEDVAVDILHGEALRAFEHGELDDLLERSPASTPRGSR